MTGAEALLAAIAALPERANLTSAEAFAMLPAPIRLVIVWAAERAEDKWGGEWAPGRREAMLNESPDERVALDALRAVCGHLRDWTF